MQLRSYPTRDNFGNVAYKFTAAFTEDDIRNIMLLSENEDTREELVALLRPAVGIEYPIRTGTFKESSAWSGTFPKDIFTRLMKPNDCAARRVFYINDMQIAGLVSRANGWASWFRDQFYNGSILRDSSRPQTFSYPINPTGDPQTKVIEEAPYMAPTLNDWKPQEPPPAPVYEQPKLASPYIPVTPKATPKPYVPEV